MKNISLPILFFVFILFTNSCKSHKAVVSSEKPFDKIGFGAKGGVTGKSKEFILYPSGEVYEVTTGTETLINKARKTQVDSIVKKIEEIGFKEIRLTETGNMTFHIYYEGKYTNLVSWTDLRRTELMELFHLLSQTAKIQ